MMRFVGIDIGSERHMVAVLDEQGEVCGHSISACAQPANRPRWRWSPRCTSCSSFSTRC